MENLLKLTLSNPKDFNFDVLLNALGQTGEQFTLERSSGQVALKYNDRMQMLQQRPASSQSPYNYIPLVTFEMAENNKIKSMELGSHMRFKLLKAYLQHSNALECQILRIFSEKAAKRLHDGVNTLSQNQKIEYAIPVNDNKLIASVYQSYYAFADGPNKEIDYLGTRGIATCTALAMVAKPEGKNPRAVVMHLDSRNNIQGSIDEAITTLKANSQEISAYVLSDREDRVDENILLTLNTLQQKGINTKLDLSDDRLIINLKSGLPIKSLRTNAEEWLVPSPQLQEKMFQSNFSFSLSAEKPFTQNAKKEYDLTTGLSGYVKKRIFD